jgi:hypothetical protein
MVPISHFPDLCVLLEVRLEYCCHQFHRLEPDVQTQLTFLLLWKTNLWHSVNWWNEYHQVREICEQLAPILNAMKLLHDKLRADLAARRRQSNGNEVISAIDTLLEH